MHTFLMTRTILDCGSNLRPHACMLPVSKEVLISATYENAVNRVKLCFPCGMKRRL